MEHIVETFKNVFNRMDKDHIHLVETLYTPDIVFRDPIHQIEGIGAMQQYFRQLYQDLLSCEVTYGQEIVAPGEAMIPWVMTLRHRRLNGGRPFEVAGVSALQYGDKIHAQQDYFDVGAMVYEQIPLLGAVVRWIKRRLQS